MEIEKLENITSGLSTALPTASANAITIAQAVNYLTYKINECVNIINRIDPEVYTKEIDAIKENLEAIEKSIDEKTEDINTINGKITSINLSIDALNEALGHKVSHTNSASVVYANDASGNETPIKFTSEPDSGTIALRTSTGQLAVADATADNHVVGYKQMRSYVSEHGGGGLSLHKVYNSGWSNKAFTITDIDVYNAIITNKGEGVILIVNGTESYTSGSAPYSFVISPRINTDYNPKTVYEVPFHTSIGASPQFVYLTITYDATAQNITLTLSSMTESGQSNYFTRVEVIVF